MISTWLVIHAASTINIYRVATYGRTAYQRVTGRRFEKEVAEFGEAVWAIGPRSKRGKQMGLQVVRRSVGRTC